MIESNGYYSLVQYCPDMGRLEAANIGVLLFCPERLFLRAKMARNNRRIIQFFGSKGHDWKRINDMKHGFEDRVAAECCDIRTNEDLERFIALRANLFQITPPRPISVRDPEEDLNQLMIELIGEPARRSSTRSFQRFLGERFSKAGLDRKLRRDISVTVPKVRRELHIPFGYQNGRFNLITPVRFEAVDAETAFKTACKYAVEGRLLHETSDSNLGRMQLVVVGRFRERDKESPAVVDQVFKDNEVKLVKLARISSLIDEIRRTAKDISTSDGTEDG